MPDTSTLMQGLALLGLLLAVRLLCARTRLAPVPLGLPSLAIVISVVHPTLSSAITAESAQPWLMSLLHLGRAYAVLQLVFWLVLELPSPISWWPHPAKILRDLSSLAIGALLTLVVLQQVAKINVVGLVTTSAILTAVIGLAAQEALKDLFAGIMLRVECPFVEGDYLELGDDLNGWVDSLTLLSTRLRHVHGGMITLPNGMIWQKHMRSFRPRGPIARELHLNLDRELPPSRATALLLQVANQSSLVLKEPPPEAIVYAYHDYAITYELEVWQEDPTDLGYDELRGELLSRIWYALERIGQRVPYPIQEFKRRQGASAPEERSDYDLEKRMEILHRSTLFGHLADEQLASIAARTRCVRFAPGEKVVVEQDHGDILYQIVSGRVAVIKTLEDGVPQEVVRLGAPAFFGEMSVFNEEPRTATVQAVEPCVLLEVERNDLRPLLEQDPAIVEQLAQIISERRAELLKLTPENTAKQGNELLNHMRRLFLGA